MTADGISQQGRLQRPDMHVGMQEARQQPISSCVDGHSGRLGHQR